MAEKTLHEQLIEDLLRSPVTPRDHAAVNEIYSLRKQLAEHEKPQKRAKADE